MPQIINGFVTADTSIVTTAETVAATVSPVTTPGPGVPVRLVGTAAVTAGATTSALTLRIRRGVDSTGVLIGEGDPIQGGVAAGSTTELALEVEERPTAELVSASYVLTVQQTAATANGTIVQADIQATVN